MAMKPRLWSINGLAAELRTDRRTVAKRLHGVPPDGRKGGFDAWYLETALPYVRGERAAPAEPEIPEHLRAMGVPFLREFGTPRGDVGEGVAATLVGVVYDAPRRIAAIAAHIRGVDMRTVYAIHHVAALALMGYADDEIAKLDFTWREADHFHWPLEPDWEALATIKGEPADVEAWERYARTCLKQDKAAE